jgi:hypothetical protein
MYIAGEAANARDIIYNSIHDIKSHMSVTVRLEPVPAEPKASHGVSLGGTFDIVVGLNTISG